MGCVWRHIWPHVVDNSRPCLLVILQKMTHVGCWCDCNGSTSEKRTVAPTIAAPLLGTCCNSRNGLDRDLAVFRLLSGLWHLMMGGEKYMAKEARLYSPHYVSYIRLFFFGDIKSSLPIGTCAGYMHDDGVSVALGAHIEWNRNAASPHNTAPSLPCANQ